MEFKDYITETRISKRLQDMEALLEIMEDAMFKLDVVAESDHGILENKDRSSLKRMLNDLHKVYGRMEQNRREEEAKEKGL